MRKPPVILNGQGADDFPGPLVLWAWNEKAAKKATAIRHLYNTLKECGSRVKWPC